MDTYNRKQGMPGSVKVQDKGSALFISEYSGNYESFLVPQQINEKNITGIEKFAFSEHRELVEIFLPDTLTEIGAHAFYNCRSLKKIVMGDGIYDIGDGAFKNCARICEIDITRKTDNTRCLKGILSEVNNEVLVTIHYEDGDSKLIFPYFLHNYEENTPARIINQITEGAGVQYRESIGTEDVNYLEYDSLFETGRNIDVHDASWKIAYYRLSFPYRLAERAERQYREFLAQNKFELVSKLIEAEDYDELKGFLAMPVFQREDFYQCIETARQRRQMEGLGILLEYQKEHYGAERKKFEF